MSSWWLNSLPKSPRVKYIFFFKDLNGHYHSPSLNYETSQPRGYVHQTVWSILFNHSRTDTLQPAQIYLRKPWKNECVIHVPALVTSKCSEQTLHFILILICAHFHCNMLIDCHKECLVRYFNSTFHTDVWLHTFICACQIISHISFILKLYGNNFYIFSSVKKNQHIFCLKYWIFHYGAILCHLPMSEFAWYRI